LSQDKDRDQNFDIFVLEAPQHQDLVLEDIITDEDSFSLQQQKLQKMTTETTTLSADLVPLRCPKQLQFDTNLQEYHNNKAVLGSPVIGNVVLSFF